MNKYCEKFAGTAEMQHGEWLKCRKKGIGGSDIAGIMGISNYSSPFSVYMDKTTDCVNDLSGNEAVYWGTVLEETVAKEFERRTGKRVRRCNAILQSKESDFAFANVDRLVVGENAGLECKTANAFSGEEWKDDEVPASYICQCQWYMYVTGCEKWYIACLIGGQKFVHKCILRDDELISYMVEKAEDFWKNNVLKGEAPPMDDSKSCGEYIKKELGESEERTVYLTSFLETLASDISEKKRLVSDIEKQIKSCENQIKQYLGTASVGKGQQYEILWKTQRGTPKLNKEKLRDIYGISDLSDCIEETTVRKFIIKEIK